MEKIGTQREGKNNLEKKLGIGTLIAMGLGAGMIYLGADVKGTLENPVSQHGYGMLWGACIATGGYYFTKMVNSLKGK